MISRGQADREEFRIFNLHVYTKLQAGSAHTFGPNQNMYVSIKVLFHATIHNAVRTVIYL